MKLEKPQYAVSISAIQTVGEYVLSVGGNTQDWAEEVGLRKSELRAICKGRFYGLWESLSEGEDYSKRKSDLEIIQSGKVAVEKGLNLKSWALMLDYHPNTLRNRAKVCCPDIYKIVKENNTQAKGIYYGRSR